MGHTKRISPKLCGGNPYSLFLLVILQRKEFAPYVAKKLYKIDDGMGCNCVPQLHAVS